MRISILAWAAACLLALFAAVDARGQINNLTREELIKYTASNPFDRFPDGRPKIPDALLEQFKEMSSEEVMSAGQPRSKAAPVSSGAGRRSRTRTAGRSSTRGRNSSGGRSRCN
jgi:hypothetical protein